MSKGWKQLNFKYKFRRVLLIVLCGFLILAVGWFLGTASSNDSSKEPVVQQEINPVENIEPLGASALDSKKESSKSEAVSAVENDPVILVEDPDWNLVVINAITPQEEEGQVTLERVSGKHRVDARVADPLKQMVAQARADGISLDLITAYQSFEDQEETWSLLLSVLLAEGYLPEEAEEMAGETLTKPGTNEYHTGLVVDILTPGYNAESLEFETSSAYRWLEEHAHEYGFILRYPKGKKQMTHMEFQPWHYRYVGTETASIIWENDYCLEEYLFVKEKSSDKAKRADDLSKREEEAETSSDISEETENLTDFNETEVPISS